MKKYIILALVALLAAVIFVACDNDVKVDNNTAYTEVLESEGAFVVNGKGYDSLQSAIQAAVDGKMADSVVITMTRNVTSSPVVIPAGADIRLYLGGHKLTFIDVEETALFVSDKAFFVLENGAVALHENRNNLEVLEVKGTTEGTGEDASTRVLLSGVIIDGNVFVGGYNSKSASLIVDEASEINGRVSAIGEHSATGESAWDAALFVRTSLNNVGMYDAYLDVTSSGHVVLTALSGDNIFVATSETSITNETDVAIVVDGGVCYIQRGEVISYYGSLQAALDDLDADNLTIIFRDDYNKSELAVEPGAGRPVIIDLNGHNVTVASITADAALTITDNGQNDVSKTFTGNIIAAGSVKASGCGLTGSVTADGDICMDSVSFIENSGNYIYAKKGGNISMTNCTGNVGAIVATNVAGSEPGNITIDNSEVISETLYTRVLTAADDYGETPTKFGNITVYANSADKFIVYGPVTGAVVTAGSPANTVKKGATFYGNITATGLISISDSTVGPNGDEDLTISTSAEDEVDGLSVVPAISMTNTSFVRKYIDEYVYAYVDVETTAGGSISLDGCSGYAGDVTSSKSLTIPSTAGDFSVLYIGTKDLTVTSFATDLYASSVGADGIVTIDAGSYGDVGISGSSESSISAGNFGNFTYNGTGTGTLNVTGGSFYGTAEFLNGKSIMLNGSYDGDGVADSSNYSLVFGDIDAVTDNVDIKCAYIEEGNLAHVEKIVNRINQDSDSEQAQQIYINYNRYGIENLTGVDNVFDMTSVNIRSDNSAYLNFVMSYDVDNVITSGLIVGKNDSTPASARFNYNNGDGKYQLKVTGRIGLLAGGNVIYSTQLNDNLVYGCTYELVDDTDDDVYGYVIRDDVYGVGSMGYYEYRYNGN